MKRQRRFMKQRRLQTRPLSSMLPNMVTILSLCTGLSAVRFAFLGQWRWAVAAVLLAGVLDGLDGRLARYLGSVSRFGAELDSLSDFVCFGVSPALMFYIQTMHHWKGFGWTIVLFFCVCSALRLARFNTHSIEGTTPTWAQGYFVGIPITVAAALSMLPFIMGFEWGESTFLNPTFCTIVLVVLGFAMISRIPIFSGKQINIPHKFVLPILLIVTLFTAALFSEPWITLTALGVGYIGLIPFSILSFRKIKILNEKIENQEAEKGLST